MAMGAHEGLRFEAEYTRYGDRVYGRVQMPSGKCVSFEVGRDGHGTFEDHGGRDLRTAVDRAAADRIFPAGIDPLAVKYGRRAAARRLPTPEFAAAVWAAAGAPGEPATVDRRPVPALAEIAAACEAEGTPLAPAYHPRPARTCVECGSPVYGEYCTHCMEG